MSNIVSTILRSNDRSNLSKTPSSPLSILFKVFHTDVNLLLFEFSAFGLTTRLGCYLPSRDMCNLSFLCSYQIFDDSCDSSTACCGKIADSRASSSSQETERSFGHGYTIFDGRAKKSRVSYLPFSCCTFLFLEDKTAHSQ